jgi:ABC-type polysaccharide/polyol phosphate export permease
MPISPGERSVTDYNTPSRYIGALWALRHFLINSVRLELANRFRYTKLGTIYIIMQPLLFALMFAWMLSTIQGQPFGEYVFYVYANMILWDLLSNSIHMGSLSIASGAGYFRMQRLPLMIFPLRLNVTLTYSLFISSVGIIFLLLVLQPQSLTVTTPLAYVNATYIAVCILPFSVASGYVGLVFHDWRQVSALCMQALWFTSPVFLHKTIFDRSDLAAWNSINPISSALDLWRMPLIEGTYPPSDAYLVLGLWALGGVVLAVMLMQRYERRALYFM